MTPWLPFTAGLLAGVATVQLMRSERTRERFDAGQERVQEAAATRREKAQAGLDAAGEKLRDAAIAGLGAVERSSARLRGRLAAQEGAADTKPPVEPATPVPPTAAGAKARKVAAKRRKRRDNE